MKRLITLLILFLITFGCKNTPTIESSRLGQMLIVGFRGTEVNSQHPVIKNLRELNVGGVILYDEDHLLGTSGRNISSQDQLLQLSSDLISNASTPPIIAVHQDGSMESPLHQLYDTSDYSDSDFLMDSVKTLNYSRLFAQEFMVLGLNTNFNPRVDLQTSITDKHTGIISQNSEEVIQQAHIILNEYDAESMFSVLKYFPGYSTSYHASDTSDVMTDLWNEDFLKPYESLLKERKIGGIMTAHSFNAQIDSTWPGTLSRKTVTGLLRDSLGFDGVIISDDMHKPIITQNYDLETAIEKALNAGVDMLVFGNNYTYDENIAPKVIETIQKLLADGRVSVETVEAALGRIQTLKQDVIAELCTCFNF